MTGRRVVLVVAAALFATAVLPPLAAFSVNQRRIDRARLDADAIAGIIAARLARHDEPTFPDGLLCGLGRMPTADPAIGPWLTAPRRDLALWTADQNALRADPWGNAFVVTIHVASGSAGRLARVLSAGPNGVIETRFRDGSAGGDDIVVRVP